VGHPDLIAGLDQIRDSYNVNGLGQVAALESLRHTGHYRRNFATVKRTRAWLTKQLAALGFETLPSQANFILTRPPGPPAREWLGRLRARKILVRWFSAPEVSGFLRITIGTPAEARKLVTAVAAILRETRGQKKTGSL
jgi:histidinol-phosphate aminotransferase